MGKVRGERHAGINPVVGQQQESTQVAHDFLKGSIWGGFVSVAGVAILSIMADPPVSPRVADAVPEGAGRPDVPVGGTARSTGDRVPVTGREAPRAPAPAADTLQAVRDGDTATAALPEVGGASGLADTAPGAGPVAQELPRAATGTAPVAATARPGLAVPDAEEIARVATDSAEPPRQDRPADAAVDTGPAPLTEDPMQPTPPQGGDGQGATGLSNGSAAAPADASTAEAAPEPDPDNQSISVDPAQPQSPPVPVEGSGFGSNAANGVDPEDVSAAPAARAVPATTGEGLGEAPASAPRIAAMDSAAGLESDAGVIDGSGVRTSPGDTAPVPRTDVPAVPAPTQEQAPNVSDTPAAAADDVDSVMERVAAQALPQSPAGQSVTVNRLPTLGSEEVAVTDEVEIDDQTFAAIVAEAARPKPVTEFAVPFEGADGKPKMAILLLDEGADLSGDAIGVSALKRFPFPVTLAVDALLPDAAARMRAYRDAGFEVLVVIDLPEGAEAPDAEVSLAAALANMPEALGVLEGPETGVQTTRDAANHVTAVLAETGHGFVAQNRGLNTVQKLAVRAGVPSAIVFRDFDDAQQSELVMRRFLDQAAFRAGQEGGVIMLGRLRPETISTLLLWGLEERAERVALAPVSQLLQTQSQ